MWDAPYTVRILTWRGFHRLAGRDTKDRCEPQPVPALVVGYDQDWLSFSPYALSYWEKLMLEPYAGPRDVAYVVLAPDDDCVVGKVKSFFRELSTTYEVGSGYTLVRLGGNCCRFVVSVCLVGQGSVTNVRM